MSSAGLTHESDFEAPGEMAGSRPATTEMISASGRRRFAINA